jgi:geranylgeranyl transferase type-1 subunit beta
MEEPKLDIDRQISYWQRCLKSLLPTQYTSTDSARMMLGFFILSALDLLDQTLPASDIKAFKVWIISCQHPNGGFCGSPNHRYPDSYYDARGYNQIESANLPATFFALLSLNLVGNIADIERSKCLRWLKRLQREDGSFGEYLERDGKVGGGMDMRYCHFASAVRWMLRGDIGLFRGEEYEDIDVDGLVRHIRSGEVVFLTKFPDLENRSEVLI